MGSFAARLLPIAVLVLGSLHSAMAQSHGYGFAGVTLGDKQLQSALRYGLGGAFAVLPRLTIGGEAGGFQKNGTGILASGNLGVHLRRRVETGFDPFATGGITGVRTGGETGLYANFGGGFNHWFRPRAAFRLEFRAYPGRQDLNSFSEIRFGISFR
jgi:hypothetical protein